MTTDHFAEDRAKLRRINDELGELAVELGEWCADNLFGDPGLVEAMRMANAAQGATLAALQLVTIALERLPPEPQPPTWDEDVLRAIKSDEGLDI